MSETWSIKQFKQHLKEKKSKEVEHIEKAIGETKLEFKPEHIFHPTRKWRFDFAIPELKIAIEYEGIVSDKSRHTNIKGYTEDSNKYNEAQKLGWRVLRYTALNYKNINQDLKQIIH